MPDPATSNGPGPQDPALRQAILQAALKAHPELAKDPAKLAFLVASTERQYSMPGAPSAVPADASRVAPGASRVQHPILQKVGEIAQMTAQGIGDVANTLNWTLTGSAPGMPQMQAQQGGDVATTLATQQAPPPVPPAAQASLQRGTALLASMAAAEAIPAIKLGSPLVGRVLSAAATDATGGTAYGLIRPLAPGESRVGAMAKDAAMFLGGGGLLRTVGFGMNAVAGKIADAFAAKTAGDIGVSLAGGAPPSAAHAAAVLDAATDVAAARVKPESMVSPAEGAQAAQPLGMAHDAPLARMAPPYADATPKGPPSPMQQAARSLPDQVREMSDAMLQQLSPTPPLEESALGKAQGEQAVADLTARRQAAVQLGKLGEASQIGGELERRKAQIPVGVDRRAPPVTPVQPPGGNPLTAIDDEIARLRKAHQAGYITTRVLTAGLGTAIRQLPQGANEPDGVYAARRTLGGLMMLGSVVHNQWLADWISGSKTLGAGLARRTAQAFDATNLLAYPGARGAMENLRNLFTAHELYVGQLERRLQDTFGPVGSEARRALAYAAGPEGQVPNNPYMAALTPKQQQLAQDIVAMHDQMGQVLMEHGLIDKAKDAYMPHVLPQEMLDQVRRPNAQAVGGLSTTPGFTRSGVFPSLEELQNWLRSKGKPLANEDGVALVAQHARAYFRTLRNEGLMSSLEEQGLLLPRDGWPPDGWRAVGIRRGGPQGVIAPEGVAKALETLNDPKQANHLGWAAYDALQAASMHVIMFNPAVHGMNLLRASLAAGVSPAGAARFYDMLQHNDPFLTELASHGWIGTGRAQEGINLQGSFDRLFKAATGHDNLSSGFLARSAGRYAEWNEQFLFGDRGLASLTGGAAAALEHTRFLMRNPEALPGSAAYDAFMDKNAKYANDVAGRLNTALRSEGAKNFMRRVFFAPQWLETRWNLTVGALKEFQDIAAGKLKVNPFDFARSALPGGWGGKGTDALYLQYQMRQVALAAATTYAISRVLTGREPEFNPNTARFYAHTGVYNRQGREVGFDPAGYWDEDIRAFNNPSAYIGGKLAFAIKAVPQMLSSRDRYGKPLSGLENLEQFMGSLGGLGSAAEEASRVVAQGRHPDPSELLGMAPSVLGAGSTVTMPDPANMLLSKVSKNLLGSVGLPTDDERTWQLSMLMKHNLEHGAPPASGPVRTYLGSELQKLSQKAPLTSILERGLSAMKQFLTQPAGY